MQNIPSIARRILRLKDPVPVMVLPVPIFAAYGELARQLQACLPHRHSNRMMHELLYVADVLHIARNGCRMFENEFVATITGPALELLWEYQESEEGVSILMHDAHQAVVDHEMRATIANVVGKLGHANRDTIRHYSCGKGSAFDALFWSSYMNMKDRHGPTISNVMMRDEVARRYGARALRTAA